MATRTRAKVKTETTPSVVEVPAVLPKQSSNKLTWALGILVALGIFWQYTNTWPVVAVVGLRPVFRFEVDQELFKQSGKTVVDSIVTQHLVEQKIKVLGIKIDDKKLDEKLAEIKKSVGGTDADFEKMIKDRGFTLAEVKKQIRLQMSIEKAVEKSASASAEEIAAYIKDNGQYMTGLSDEQKKTEAETAVKQQNVQKAINDWVEQVRKNGKVWSIFGGKTQ